MTGMMLLVEWEHYKRYYTYSQLLKNAKAHKAIMRKEMEDVAKNPKAFLDMKNIVVYLRGERERG